MRVPVFDADNHLYETRDSFTQFLPKEHKGLIEYVDIRGRTKIAVRGQISDYIPNPTFDVVARPGAQEEYFRQGNKEGKSRREILGEPMRAIPAFREPQARMELLDELQVDRTLMFPTLASLLEERLRDDVKTTHVVIHALNEWILEQWKYNYHDRIFTTPVITLPIVEEAIKELEFVLENGAKVILIRPAPVPSIYGGSRSPFGVEFDPFWKLVESSGVLAAFHGSDSGYARHINEWKGKSQEMRPFESGAPQAFNLMQSTRPAEDTVTAMVCDGVLSRFPGLKMAVVELGSAWMGPLVEKFDHVYEKVPQDFREHPVEQIRRNVNICGFWEDDFKGLADYIGEDNVLFGSDYPHPEGLAQPAKFADDLEATGLSEATIAKMMGGNLARLMGYPIG